MAESSSRRAQQSAKKKNDSISLKVKGQDGREFTFKINGNTKIKKLLKAYCTHVQADYKTLRFYCDGQTFPVLQTPNELHMDDGDEIEAMVHFRGG